MPKKRKKNRKAPHKPAVVRTAPTQYTDPEVEDWDDDPEEEFNPLASLKELLQLEPRPKTASRV
ncbi:hypothetical protein [Streptomyces sp. NPDC090135]|uniref:hypothetical protein n=1 Tax=Streptomyces sp. NPDC090135 TaxID=3365957 RepID=UPI0038262D4A